MGPGPGKAVLERHFVMVTLRRVDETAIVRERLLRGMVCVVVSSSTSGECCRVVVCVMLLWLQWRREWSGSQCAYPSFGFD